jgi:hypothetical protein
MNRKWWLLILAVGPAWAAKPKAPKAEAPVVEKADPGAAATASATLASLKTVDITYHVTWDLNEKGDSMCQATQLCDCQSIYAGSGAVKEVDGNRVTFEGTWSMTANDCGDNFTIWRPEEGSTKAFHTVRFDDARQHVTEWIAHRDAEQVDPLSVGMKKRGQFWINELGAAWTPAGAVSSLQVEEDSIGFGINIQTSHDLKLAFH